MTGLQNRRKLSTVFPRDSGRVPRPWDPFIRDKAGVFFIRDQISFWIKEDMS